MSDVPASPNNAPDSAAQPVELDTHDADGVGGGLSCNPDHLPRFTASLKETYENLVDFTSHVIERVAGK